MTGLKRVDAPTRAATPRSSAGTTPFGLVKVNPLATWTDDDIAVLPGRPRPARRTPSCPSGYLSIGCAPDDPSGGRGRGPARRALGRARQDRVRAARLTCPRPGQSLRDRVPGPERPMAQVRPALPQHRRAEPGRAAQARRATPSRWPHAVIDTYSKEGAGRHRQGARGGGAAQVGRPLPPAPGRRRLHDADQGPRRRPDRGPGPRDRGGRRRLRRGARRQPGVRQPLRRPHDPPGHPAPLDPHRRRPPDLAALLRTSG